MNLNKPWSVQIELHYGCNFRCDTCYKQVLNLQKSDFKSMTITTALNIAKKLKKFEPIRIEFAMRGEPTLNKNWLKIIGLFRKHLTNSHIMLTSNGSNLNRENIRKFFEVGGNVLLVDCYKKDLEKRKKEWHMFNPLDYYTDDFNPYHRHSTDTKVLMLMDNLMERNHDKKTRVISNLAGNVDYSRVKKYGVNPLQHDLNKKCVRPFREMIILYNGDIVLCCADASSDFKLGNVNKNDLEQVWFNSKKLNLARLLLYNKCRKFAPCYRCDFNGGMRQGLIPKMKKLTEEEINKYKNYLRG